MIGFWEGFWHIVVVAALVSYFGLAIVIAIGGGFDVRKMFQRLSAPHESDLGSADTEAASPQVTGKNNDTNESINSV